MKQYCRVEVPMLSVKSIREAEPGMELEEAAFSRDGRVIAEEGDILTEDRIQKFKNLDVRKIIILTSETQWVPEEDLAEWDRPVDVLERKKFSEAPGEIVEDIRDDNSMENLRNTAMHLGRQAHSAGDAEGSRSLDRVVEESYDLQQDVESLEERIREVDDEDAREALMEALQGEISNIDETMLDVNAPDSLIKRTINTVQEKNQLQFTLNDYVMNNTDVLSEDVSDVEVEGFDGIEAPDAPWTESLTKIDEGDVLGAVKSLMEVVDSTPSLHESHQAELEALQKRLAGELKNREALLSELESYDLSPENYGRVKSLLDGEANLRKSELYDLPISDEFARKTYEFVQEQVDTRYRLWEKTDEVSGGKLDELLEKGAFIENSLRTETPEELTPDDSDPAEQETEPEESTAQADLEREREELSTTIEEDEVERTVETIREEGAREGVDQLVDALEDREDADDEEIEQVLKTRDRLDRLSEEKNQIEETIKERIDDPGVRDELLAILQGDRDFDPESFMEIDAPPGLLEEVADTLLNEMNAERNLWGRVEQATPDTLDRGDDAETNRRQLNRKLERTVDAVSGRGEVNTEGTQERESSRDEQEQPDSLRDYVSDKKPYEIANAFDMDVSTVKNALQLLEPPRNLDGAQKQFCDPLIDEAHKIFYGHEIDDDALEQIAYSLADRMSSHESPIKMLLDPPSGDQYLLTHGINTCLLSLRLASELDLDSSQLLDLATAGLSLDFGMVEIPMGLWVKNEALTKRGDQEVKKHPSHSREIIETAVNDDTVITDLVNQHHERVDGSGYPEGLTQSEQHPLAALLAGADAYVAMLEARPYREGKMPDTVLKTMLSNREQYDKNVIQALLKNVGFYPNGCLVLLSDGRLGWVRSQTPGNPTHPSVLVSTDEQQNQLDSPYMENLAEEDASVNRIMKR